MLVAYKKGDRLKIAGAKKPANIEETEDDMGKMGQCYVGQCEVEAAGLRRCLLSTCRQARECERLWRTRAESDPIYHPGHCREQAKWWRGIREQAVREYRHWVQLSRASN